MKPSNVLQTSVGYFALLNIMVDILDEVSEKEKFDITTYEKYLSKATSINVKDLKRYPLTSKSRSILYLDLSLKIWMPKDGKDERLMRLEQVLNKD
jgi:hypothetical protein